MLLLLLFWCGWLRGCVLGVKVVVFHNSARYRALEPFIQFKGG